MHDYNGDNAEFFFLHMMSMRKLSYKSSAFIEIKHMKAKLKLTLGAGEN